MAKKKDVFAMVREIGITFPGVREEAYFGKPGLKIGKEMIACVASHKSAEPWSLVVRIAVEERAELLASNPDAYYVTEHYEGFRGVLVRLDRVGRGELRDLLGVAHKFVKESDLAGRRKKAKR
jgi:hypothetical protein